MCRQGGRHKYNLSFLIVWHCFQCMENKTRHGNVPGDARNRGSIAILEGGVGTVAHETGGERAGSKKKITAKEALEMLKGMEDGLEAIDKKMSMLYRELGRLEGTDELLDAVALPAQYAGMPRGGGGHADNLDVLLRYYRQKRERREEIRMQMWRLSEEAESIRRVWGCFLALPEPYYGILHSLYVERKLYRVTEMEFGRSHRMFEQKRSEGLKRLAEMYNSGYSSLELMEMGCLHDAGGRRNPGQGQA